MTNTQKFIELAIEGGWNFREDPSGIQNISFKKTGVRLYTSRMGEENGTFVAYEEVILDPKAWKAVADIKNWNEIIIWGKDFTDDVPADYVGMLKGRGPEWRFRWHILTDFLASGSSIEEALKEILS